jgi:hypothetical protein
VPTGNPAAATASAAGQQSAAPSAAAASAAGSPASPRVRQCAACFVTSRILVVDLLSNRLRPQQIAGVLTQDSSRHACRRHASWRSCNEQGGCTGGRGLDPENFLCANTQSWGLHCSFLHSIRTSHACALL